PTYGSWLGLVGAVGDLTEFQALRLAMAKAVLSGLETTRMTRSFKMLVLTAMLNEGALPDPGVQIDKLAKEFKKLVSRSSRLIVDVGIDLDDANALRRYLEGNPIAAWTGPGAISDAVYFTFEAGNFRFVRAI